MIGLVDKLKRPALIERVDSDLPLMVQVTPLKVVRNFGRYYRPPKQSHAGSGGGERGEIGSKRTD